MIEISKYINISFPYSIILININLFLIKSFSVYLAQAFNYLIFIY